jgi:hypothetical protein
LLSHILLVCGYAAAAHLKESGAMMYGAFWCSHCEVGPLVQLLNSFS